MSTGSIRPRLKDLVFAVYARPLHPELFDILQSEHEVQEQHEFSVWITDCGHVVTWRHGDLWLTEVLTAAYRPLPRARRVLSFRVHEERSEKIQCANVMFQLSCGVEQLKPDLFHRIADELEQDSRGRPGVVQRFPAPDRLHPSAFSYVMPDSRPQRLLVYSYHTFPEDYGVVKTQTIYEILD